MCFPTNPRASVPERLDRCKQLTSLSQCLHDMVTSAETHCQQSFGNKEGKSVAENTR